VRQTAFAYLQHTSSLAAVRTLLVVEERVRVGFDEGAVAVSVPASSRRAEQKLRGWPLSVTFF